MELPEGKLRTEEVVDGIQEVLTNWKRYGWERSQTSCRVDTKPAFDRACCACQQDESERGR
jgi:hypothetical protein